MKIGELFVTLGFKIEGDKDLQGVERSMTKATGSATKLAIEVAALNAAFLYMIETSMKAAVFLRNFAISTNLSTSELQLWTHAAVVNGLSADTLTDSIIRLQDARAKFALGDPQAVGAWTLLGVDPRADPFVVLAKLRDRLKDVHDIGVARNLLGDVGLAGLLPLLRSTNREWEEWNKNFIVTKEQTDKLAALNAAWQSLKLSVSSLAIQFSSIFTPVLVMVARNLEWLTVLVVKAVKWLQSAGPVTHYLRMALELLAVEFIALGVLLAGLIALLGTLAAVLSFVASGAFALLAEFAPFVLLIGASLVAIAGLILLLQDLWTQLQGGKSAFDWLHSSVPEIWALAHGLENILKLWKEIKQLGAMLPTFGLPVLGMNAIPLNFGGGPSSSKTEVQQTVTVNESATPRATANDVMRRMASQYRGALNQSPVRSY